MSPSSGRKVVRDTTASSRLITRLRDSIESGELRAGDKLATIRNLAHQYDITFDAARSAVARLESMGYVIRKRRSGTFVDDTWQMRTPSQPHTAAPASKSQQQYVALILDSKVHHYGRFFDKLVLGLQEAGYIPSLFRWRMGWGDQEMQPILDYFENTPPHAVVIQQLNGGRYDRQIQAVAKKHNVRVISGFLGNMLIPDNWHKVHADEQAAAAIAAQYLMDKGHKRIGLIVHDRNILDSDPASLRKRAYGHTRLILGAGHALRDAGIHDGLQIYYQKRISIPEGANPMTNSNKQQALDWLRSPDRPDAFIGEDYRIAALLRVAFENNIKLPENFQVVGIGNTPWAKLMGFPSVWLREDLAAEHVMNLIQMKDVLFNSFSHQVMIKPKLVEHHMAELDDCVDIF